MSRFIDISVSLRAGIASDPPVSRPEIEYLHHEQTAPRMANAMGIAVEDLPNRLAHNLQGKAVATIALH